MVKVSREELELIAEVFGDPVKRSIVKLLLKEERGLSFFLIQQKIGGSRVSIAKALHELTEKGLLAYSIEQTSTRVARNYSINIEHLSTLSRLMSDYRV